MNIKLFNTASKKTESFHPIDPARVTMYVCGPTVYDRPHIGNARSVVVYDVLYRMLIENFGAEHVCYVRNITDVDDKINKAAKDSGVSIQSLTESMTNKFHLDIKALNCIEPNVEPRATRHIEEMIAIIETLIECGSAYISQGHVYFDVSSFKGYGELAQKNLEDLIAGSRVEVSDNKQTPEDFVLWKPADQDDDISSVFESPWGKGRPGWHIECSAMSSKYLGDDFDIHGGGIDLIFPHHTNEIAQSCSYKKGSSYARYWVHNGFVTVDGEKMSKSLGNFWTVKDLLDKDVRGETIRYVYLSTHYRKPLNWTDKAVEDSKKSLDSFYRIISRHSMDSNDLVLDPRIREALYDDMNTPLALSIMHEIAKDYNKTTNHETQESLAGNLLKAGLLLGLFYTKPEEWFGVEVDFEIDALIQERIDAKKAKNWGEADKIRNILQEKNIILEDHPDGTTTWRKI